MCYHVFQYIAAPVCAYYTYYLLHWTVYGTVSQGDVQSLLVCSYNSPSVPELVLVFPRTLESDNMAMQNPLHPFVGVQDDFASWLSRLGIKAHSVGSYPGLSYLFIQNRIVSHTAH